jgi:hypothetical protein
MGDVSGSIEKELYSATIYWELATLSLGEESDAATELVADLLSRGDTPLSSALSRVEVRHRGGGGGATQTRIAHDARRPTPELEAVLD